MAVKVYNTMTRRREELAPIQEGKLGIYVCGITVYDLCHIGHARSAVVFDTITKYLRFRGYDVTYVKNFTDVDDKIINKANAEHVTIKDISEKYIREHNRDMDALGVARPDIAPKATENIPGMIELISKLMEKGLAYVSDGDVYYAVDKFKGYGKLSGRNLDDMMAGARIEVGEKKRNPMDFALWKGSKENEPWWESPWGKGRPGWHIECSVMSQRFLGTTFDIHGGGEDLIFPHHENEIAQSEGASGQALAKYWIHNGFIKINSEKMSKSLGNVFSIRDILEKYHPEAVRLFILQTHYRNPIDFSDESLSEARAGMDRFYATLKAVKDDLAKAGAKETQDEKGTELVEKITGLKEKFTEAMDDDFNSARALGYLFDGVRTINAYLTEQKSNVSKPALVRSREMLKELGFVFGLFLDDPDEYFRKDRDREARKLGIDIADVEKLIQERNEARAARDWKRADEIRNALIAKRVSIKDSAAGTTWKID